MIRTLTSNVSRDGLFLRMPEPLPPGMKVALSLEAGGRALALAQAEVRWNGPDAEEVTERFPGCGVRFTEFMHPRAEELVRYLVKNLDTGKPLALAPPERRWTKYLPFAGGGALLLCAAMAAVIFWEPDQLDEPEPAEVKSEQSAAAAPEPVAQAWEPELALAPEAVAAKSPEPEVVKPAEPLIAKVAAAPIELKVEAPKPAPIEKRRKAEREGDVKLPAGGAPHLHWEVSGTELRLTPQLPGGVQVSRAFVLTGPPRAVFDLRGGAEARSISAPAAPPYATAVRIGKQPAGTRIVVDLDDAPKRTQQLGDVLVLGF